MKIALQILGIFALCFLIACEQGPKTEQRVREAAQEVFLKQCAHFHCDPNLFSGPTRIEVGGADFAYEWRYKDAGSDFGILVAVNRYGVKPTYHGQPPQGN